MATLESLASDYEKEKQDIKNQYAGFINDYTNLANKQANQSIVASDNTYNSAVKNAYIQNMRNSKALKDNLARSGITGGATETSLLNAQNNYINAVGKLQSDKASAASSARQNADNNIANQTLAYNEKLQNALSTAQTNYDTRVNNQRAYDQQVKEYEESIRQYNESLALQREQMAAEQARYEQERADTLAQQQIENARYEQERADTLAKNEYEKQQYANSLKIDQYQDAIDRATAKYNNATAKAEQARADLANKKISKETYQKRIASYKAEKESANAIIADYRSKIIALGGTSTSTSTSLKSGTDPLTVSGPTALTY